MTYLSPHFSLAEMTATEHRGIDNTPPAVVMGALTDTASRMEAVRDLLGHPVHVNSAFRCLALNRAVGGAISSAHLTGHAVDFICPGFGDPLAVCKALEASDLEFDQVITEGSWSHISFDPRMRRQVLTKAVSGGYTKGLNP